MWSRFPPLDSSFISILLAKYESSRPLKHICLVANCDITLIHQEAVGKSAPPWQLLINFQCFYHTVGWHVVCVGQTWTVAVADALKPHVDPLAIIQICTRPRVKRQLAYCWSTGNSALFTTTDIDLSYFPSTVCKELHDLLHIFKWNAFGLSEHDRSSPPSSGEQQWLNPAAGGCVVSFSLAKISPVCCWTEGS